MKNLSRIAATSLLLVCCLSVSAQTPVKNAASDFDFAVRQVEENYAGYPSRMTDAGRVEYEALKERLRSDVADGRDGCEAAGELFGWFGDFHLRAGIYTDPYLRPRCDYGGMEYAPQHVACSIDERTYLIRVPSFEFDETLMAWIARAVGEYEWSGCDNLIVDIRGNGGGRDQAFQPLLELLYDHPGTVDGVEIRVSADNEAFVRRAIADGGPDWLRPVADSMATATSDFVPFTLQSEPIRFDSVALRPRHAAIIIDGNVASSGEQFVLDLRACSARTKIYGRDNTLGCLDFSNCIPVNLPFSGVTLSVPVTRSMRLPERGIDATGIAPDVRIALPLPRTLTDNVDAWVQWVAADLKTEKPE